MCLYVQHRIRVYTRLCCLFCDNSLLHCSHAPVLPSSKPWLLYKQSFISLSVANGDKTLNASRLARHYSPHFLSSRSTSCFCATLPLCCFSYRSKWSYNLSNMCSISQSNIGLLRILGIREEYMKSTSRQLCSSDWPTVKAPHWIPSFFRYFISNFTSDISKDGQFYKKMHSKNK